MKHNQLGLTLLEVMVALAIVAMVTAIALPNFSSSLQSDRVEMFMSEFNKNLKNARNQATAHSEFVIVCPLSSTTKDSSCLTNWKDNDIATFIDLNNNQKFDAASDELLRVQDKINTRDALAHTTGTGAIRFDSMGRLEQEHQFVACAQGGEEYTYAVQVTMSGNAWKLGRNTLTCS